MSRFNPRVRLRAAWGAIATVAAGSILLSLLGGLYGKAFESVMQAVAGLFCFMFLGVGILGAWRVTVRLARAPAEHRRAVRRRRLLRGHCPACDYDLRGTPDQCPECGWERPVGTELVAVDAAAELRAMTEPAADADPPL